VVWCAIAKCWCSGGIEPLAPAFMALVFDTSSVSPIPTRNVPFFTTTASSVGWKWGGILYPLGIERSMVNISALVGSPLTTAIFAPLGKTAGAGPQVSVASLLELAWP